eukprot:gene19561-10487_t
MRCYTWMQFYGSSAPQLNADGERNVLKSGGIPDISVTTDAVNVNAGGSLHVQNLPDMPYPHADDDANTGVALMGLTFIC